MVGVLAPRHGHRLGVGGGLEPAVRPAEPVGQQLLAARRARRSKPARRGEAAPGPRGVNAWTSTWRLELVVARRRRRCGPRRAALRAQQRAATAAPGAPRAALGVRGDAVAVARRLAGEERRVPPGRSTRWNSREGAVEVGQVVQDGVAEDEVEGRVLERQRLGVGDAGVARRGPAARRCRAASRASRARCRCRSPARTTPARSRLQREVAGAGADLERARRRSAVRRPSALRSLPRTWAWPTSPKSMPHLAS